MLIEHEDLTIMMDNEALHNISANKLEVDLPNYNNLNSLIA
jgi:hypothetical protein